VTDQPVAFQQLDFVYTPSRDVAADLAYFTEVLGGRVVFAVEAMGTRVVAIQLTERPPLVLLAEHLEGDRPILVYRVANLDVALAGLAAHGWQRQPTLEIPPGAVLLASDARGPPHCPVPGDSTRGGVPLRWAPRLLTASQHGPGRRIADVPVIAAPQLSKVGFSAERPAASSPFGSS
jgi:hypothetical protein